MKTVRCAIYTRKSNDEGLEKEFNTLEAQREAGENYIRSQVHQGWTIIEKHYDDGGYSGGTMKRPALQELFQDIESGFIDMIVVYKIDRLSRSLLDFTKMIELFDRHNCSFISVTQNFNTADSMGRLMLNVLLSFAQFEREISGERIRDKVAATRKKGMWTGGRLPLGYDVVNKKLIINQKEAEIVRYIFNRYPEVPSELIIANELNEKGWHPKLRNATNTPSAFQASHISSIVQNPIYIGKIKFHNELYDGIHQPIIEKSIFEKVNKIKKQKNPGRPKHPEYKDDGLLKNLIQCGCCDSPMHITTIKRGPKRYRYYISDIAEKKGHSHCDIAQVNAGEFENIILKTIKPLFKTTNFIQTLANETKSIDLACQEREVFDAMSDFEEVFVGLSLSACREILHLLIRKIIVYQDYILIDFRNATRAIMPQKMLESLEPGTNMIKVPYCLIKKRGKTVLLSAQMTKTETDQALIKAIVRAFQWTKTMETEGITQKELAKREHINCGYLGKIMRLTILAPNIIQAILEGKQPTYLTVDTFMRNVIPYRWDEQRIKFKFK